MKRILRLLKSRSKAFYLLIILLGLGNSLIYSGILYFINQAITNQPVAIWPAYDWVLYLSIIAFSAACNIISQKYLIVLTNEMLVNYENSVLTKVKHATYEKFEKMGKQKIYAALGDSWILAEFPRTFVASANTLIIVLCSIGYMFTVNVPVAATFTVFLVLLSIGFIRSGITIKNEFSAIQRYQDQFYGYMTDFLDGYKEVKMRILRADNILGGFIYNNRAAKKKLSIQTYTKDTIFGFISRFTWYLLIGSIVFLFPRILNFPIAEMTVCLLIVLHMLESMNFFLGNIPFYFRVDGALKKMEDLDQQVEDFRTADMIEKVNLSKEPFESIVFENVEYTYFDEHNSLVFSLGPVNVTLRKNETVFVEGGNGSGKSTFVNLLTGLYIPQSGNIYYNGEKIDLSNADAYRDKLSSIFTSNHLFSENYDEFDIREQNVQLSQLIDMVQLRNILRIDTSKNWFKHHLSKGQQKRLALVYSLLENRDVLIMDEWAAEQDPAFRAYFYQEIINRLKSMGKTIILITHDDRYINQADRVIKFEEGRIVQDALLKPLLEPQFVG
ncbi:putative ATP-binding cassette transporter/putative ATP-binding cassette transporter [Chitinophaga skermanii]|uniref:Putative ATP-binding cassette transporter/putative ATP-binding cassette transporter n=1 Tax=Chitinophaga skermanii TaxID=331697 RepID=A0A327R2U6_9BACT|nr:ATP-binding cassette domain-containing protein [Chitinophaga skermanii]RAJ11146.1 putative ATP-binding cassette transporter/putative ATP-binding cassette transporter [Chitinophaga skermanii]